MTLVYIALGIAAFVYLLRRKGEEARGQTVAEVVESYNVTEPAAWGGPNEFEPTHVLIYEKEWWPRVKKIGEETFDVKTKDVNKVIEAPVSLSYWSDRARGGYVEKGLYQIVFNGGRVVDGGHDGGDGGFNMFKETKKYEAARIDHVRWSKDAKPYETEEGVWSLTLEVWSKTGPYPWHREKGDPFYLHTRTRNLILEKYTDPEEIAAAFEAKMAEVYAKAVKK